jgi:hypothetical protein
MNIIKWIQETFCKEVIEQNAKLLKDREKANALILKLDTQWKDYKNSSIEILNTRTQELLTAQQETQSARQELAEANLTDVDKWCKKNNIPMVEKAYKDKIFINELKLPCYLNELFLPTAYVIKKAKEKIKYDTDDCTWFTRITNYVHNKVKWTYDGMNDNYYYPNYTLQKGLGDCLPENTLLLKSDGTYCKIKDISVGDKIIGKDGESVFVTKKWNSGVKLLRELKVEKQTIVVSEEHKMLSEKKEKRARDIIPEDRLDYPQIIKLENPISLESDFAYLIGLFIADGWWDKLTQLPISGLDGKPKEKQKEWVKDYCMKKGYNFYWHRKYIGINNKELVEKVKQYVNKDKTFKTINFDKKTLECLLEGLKADASIRPNELTYGTIKPILAIQIRSMYRMLGYQCSIRKDINHGGFGKNPIYRVGVKIKNKNLSRRKVLSNLEIGSGYCYDIETSNHGIYLPEFDIEVHNCEDQAYVQMSIEPQIAVAYGFRIESTKEEFGHSFGVGVIGGELFIFDAVDNEVKKYTKNDGWRIHFIVTKNGTYVLDNSVEFGEILWG